MATLSHTATSDQCDLPSLQELLAAALTEDGSTLSVQQTKLLPRVFNRAAQGLRHGTKPPDTQVMRRMEPTQHPQPSQQHTGELIAHGLLPVEATACQEHRVRGTVA